MSKNMKIWLGVFAIAFSSAVIGGVTTAFYIKHKVLKVIEQGPKGTRLVAMKVLRRRLRLSNEQVKEIRPLVREAQRKLIELRQSHRPEVEAILNQAVSEIHPKLEPKQREEFDRLTQRIMKRFSSKFK